jgi:biotin carboxyl carrier protein
VILRLRRGRSVHAVEVRDSPRGAAQGSAQGPAVAIDGVPFEAEILRLSDGSYSILSGGRSLSVVPVPLEDGWTVHSGGRRYRLRLADAAGRGAGPTGAGSGPREIRATLPGKIVQVPVHPGAEVKEGAPLVIIEAMKMENELRAPFDARIVTVAVEPGQTVETGTPLLALEPLATAPDIEPED